jgi:hypothetical protein
LPHLTHKKVEKENTKQNSAYKERGGKEKALEKNKDTKSLSNKILFSIVHITTTTTNKTKMTNNDCRGIMGNNVNKASFNTKRRIQRKD